MQNTVDRVLKLILLASLVKYDLCIQGALTPRSPSWLDIELLSGDSELSSRHLTGRSVFLGGRLASSSRGVMAIV